MKRQVEQKKIRRHWLQCSFGGLLGGLVLYCLSLTPSLLPTPPLFEGLTAGISFAFGYGIGVCSSWAIRKLAKKELVSKQVKKIAWTALFVAAPLLVIAYGVWTASWQNAVRHLMGEPSLEGHHIIVIVLIACLTAALLIACSRLIALAIRRTSKLAGRWVPARFSAAIGTVVVALLLLWLYNGVLAKTFVAVSNRIYSKSNDQTDVGITRPGSNLRSGSDASVLSWDTLGREGRTFVASGPSQEQLSSLSGRAATEPIRVYAGLRSADTAEARAALAVQELKRSHAFDRAVLCVMTPTGTGWIEPQSADSLEYMWNGNTALVSVQYSYLPSWISFLVDQQNATDTGRALFDAIYHEWKQLPSDKRPKLIAYGLSLGSYGAQAAFSGADDLQNRTDGALFMGTPSYSQPWGHFTMERDMGSHEWQPTYQKGQAVRFAANESDLAKQQTSWSLPRILYMQHASDPVVWWNYNLLLHKPDWLKEPRGPDVSPDMKWYPFVTLFQTSADQLFATSVPPGHGHNYSNTIVAAWAAVTRPNEWNAKQAEKLQKIIDTYPID